MKIWILQTGEPVHSDGGSPRPMRAMSLADALVARGHEVVLWSSAFYHQEKRHRARRFTRIELSRSFSIHLVPSTGYRRNIGIGRLVDHAVLGLNLHRILETMRFDPPDVAFVGYPPIESAFVMERWLRKHGVPVMVDAKDQWPDIFVEPIPRPLRLVGRLMLAPYFMLSRSTFANATAFCSMSDDFITWMCGVAGRQRRDVDYAAPLTAEPMTASEGELDAARLWWASQGVDLSSRARVSFVGSFTASFDFRMIRDLAARCLSDGISCQFVVCGDGDQAPAVRALLSGLPNVILPGWIDRPKIKTLYDSTAAIVAPYRSNDAFDRSVPNKIVDALAAGLGVVASLDGVTARLVDRYRLGKTSPSAEILYKELVRIVEDQQYRDSVHAAALSVYEQHFSFHAVYDGLARRVESLRCP